MVSTSQPRCLQNSLNSILISPSDNFFMISLWEGEHTLISQGVSWHSPLTYQHSTHNFLKLQCFFPTVERWREKFLSFPHFALGSNVRASHAMSIPHRTAYETALHPPFSKTKFLISTRGLFIHGLMTHFWLNVWAGGKCLQKHPLGHSCFQRECNHAVLSWISGGHFPLEDSKHRCLSKSPPCLSASCTQEGLSTSTNRSCACTSLDISQKSVPAIAASGRTCVAGAGWEDCAC